MQASLQPISAQQADLLQQASALNTPAVRSELHACGLASSRKLEQTPAADFLNGITQFVTHILHSLPQATGNFGHSTAQILSSSEYLSSFLSSARDFFLIKCFENVAPPFPEGSLHEQATFIRQWIEMVAPELQTLSLRGKGLPFIPKEICRLTSLTWLSVENNALYFLPQTIRLLKSLRGLYAANNKLESIPSLEKLKRLSDLSLQRNKLTSLPSLPKRIEELDLSDNQLPEISPAVLSAKRLKNLDLANNRIREIPSAITDLQELESLDLKNNAVTFVSPELTELAKEGVLEEIDLSSNPLKAPLNEVLQQLQPTKPTIFNSTD
jgi:Leucine-rich repeat (LRR) protein